MKKIVVPVFDFPFPPAVVVRASSRERAKRFDDTRLPGWIRGRSICYSLSAASAANG